jgi:hypothetical protein
VSRYSSERDESHSCSQEGFVDGRLSGLICSRLWKSNILGDYLTQLRSQLDQVIASSTLPDDELRDYLCTLQAQCAGSLMDAIQQREEAEALNGKQDEEMSEEMV